MTPASNDASQLGASKHPLDRVKRSFFWGNWPSKKEELPRFLLPSQGHVLDDLSEAILKYTQERFPDAELRVPWESKSKKSEERSLRVITRLGWGESIASDVFLLCRRSDLYIRFDSLARTKARIFRKSVLLLLTIIIFGLSLRWMVGQPGFYNAWVDDFAQKHAISGSVSYSKGYSFSKGQSGSIQSTGLSSNFSGSWSDETSVIIEQREELEKLILNGRKPDNDQVLGVLGSDMSKRPDLLPKYNDLAREYLIEAIFVTKQAIDKLQPTINALRSNDEARTRTFQSLPDRDPFERIHQTANALGSALADAQPAMVEKEARYGQLVQTYNHLQAIGSELFDEKEPQAQMQRVVRFLLQSAAQKNSVTEVIDRTFDAKLNDQIELHLQTVEIKPWTVFQLLNRDWLLFLSGPGKVPEIVLGVISFCLLAIPKSTFEVVFNLLGWPTSMAFGDAVLHQNAALQALVGQALKEKFGITLDQSTEIR